ncbi:sulfatase-like hydrolase/transferase [Variovorax sp. J22P168]|uniref:sulfatase-like hydrolase/transferase n=1 Tax=Variovorax jilinensis TaxID=3053513 RepID=UPI0025756E1C|nr:sulfatase-like hydrolase/transferase [Variovorax sp. J22P168]MDM0014134.1 sulfatase-like hydrolase/transferase [Variovorax sp. J22P168]
MSRDKLMQASLALLALCLPMLPAIVAAHLLGFYRPLFWLEFLVLSALVVRRNASLFCAVLALIWIGDFLFGFAQINLSPNYSDVLDLLTYLPYANKGWLIGGAAIIVGLIAWGALCVFVFKRVVNRQFLFIWLVLILGLAVSVPRLTGFEHERQRLYLIQGQKLAGSWLMDTAFMRNSLGFYNEGYAPDIGQFRPIAPSDSAVATLLSGNPLPERLLVVVVESWGMPTRDDEMQFWFDMWKQPGIELLHRGAVKYQGATMTAEFRELCGFVPLSLRIDDVPNGANCLPHKLREQGYQTSAFHGASGKMYRRERWYPQIGFNSTKFMSDLNGRGRWCQNVPGVCDYSIADEVVDSATGEKKAFTYWMTLNSHTPYSLADLSEPSVKDEVCGALKLKEERCDHSALLFDFMRSLQKSLRRESANGLTVLLVGDHTPKFLKGNGRDEFEEDRVPYLIFRVKNEGGVPSH